MARLKSGIAKKRKIKMIITISANFFFFIKSLCQGVRLLA
jgi:hypothetical protein